MITGSQAIRALQADGPPIVILAAIPAGEAVLHACAEYGIPVRCFCDSKPEKAAHGYCGLEVVHTPQLGRAFPEARIIIAAPGIEAAVAQLARLGYGEKDMFPAASILRDFRIGGQQFTVAPEYIEYSVAACIANHESFLRPEMTVIRSVDVVVTERCSLKCRDCSNLMQYYANPVDGDAGEILASVDALCGAVDAVHEFRVIGGEPFMRRDWPEIVEALLERQPDRYVAVYTNGTIAPDVQTLSRFSGKRVVFYITDYGPLSRGLNVLVTRLSGLGLAWNRVVMDGWTDCARIEPHNRDQNGQQKVFDDCCAKKLHTLLGGRLYHCPFAANAVNLGAIPDDPGNRLSLLETDGGAPLRRRTAEFLANAAPIPACRFCCGRDYYAPADFPPAIQTSAPLAYTRYGGDTTKENR